MPPRQPWPQPNLVLTIIQKGSLGLSLLPTTVICNGVRLPAALGDNPYVIPPGPLTLEAWGTWTFGRVGHVTWQQVLQPGEQLHLYWAVPSWAWIRKGRIGLQPMPSEGFGCLVAVLVGLAVGMLALILASILLLGH